MTSRKHPPHRYDKRLWKGGYAWSSFADVRDVCDHLLTEKISTDARMYYPLVTAIAVLYARPFKRSKGIESLTPQSVPKKFRSLHEQIILLRDQTVAHLDTRGALFGDLPANNVRLIVRGNRFQLGMDQVKFQTAIIVQIRELADALANRMLKYAQKIASNYPGGVPRDGEYLIDLTTGLFRPLNDN